MKEEPKSETQNDETIDLEHVTNLAIDGVMYYGCWLVLIFLIFLFGYCTTPSDDKGKYEKTEERA